MRGDEMRQIVVPDAVRSGNHEIIVSVSGGKDSTATVLALREAGVSCRLVFADTGWEAPETYAHLEHLREKLGPIDVVSAERTMADAIRHRAGFPSRMQRWCTRELKVLPLREYHDRFDSTVSVLGIRADESESRSSLPEWEDSDRWGGLVWRPILRWSVADVLAIHHRHGVEVNPLYKRGHNRVGCYPCIYAAKDEIRLVAEHSPSRIDEIRSLEAECTSARAARNAETPGRYAHEQATFFMAIDRETMRPNDIDEVVSWSRTARGGRQLTLLQSDPEGGCFRWGMCEPPSGEK